MQPLLDALAPHERRAVALVGLMIRMHGGMDGEGAFTGVGRYGILTSSLRLCAEQSRSVQGLWDRAARRLRWSIGPQRYDDAALALLAPDETDAETLRALAERTQSIVMIARSLARRERTPRTDAPSPSEELPPFNDPLDIFLMEPEPVTVAPDSEKPSPPAQTALFGN